METSLREKLKKAGMKATSQKLAILNIFANNHKPLSIKEITEKIKIKIEESTVYRSIDQMVSANILTMVQLKKDSALYELNDPENHHHHILCKICEKIEDVHSCNMKDFQNNVLKKSKHFSDIKSHSLEFFGVCKNCSKNSK